MNGNYLICPDDAGTGDKIYLLLQVEGDLIGIRIDRGFKYSAEAQEKDPLKLVIEVLRRYEKIGWVVNSREEPLPILDGGDDKKGLFYVYNDLDASSTDPIARMYSAKYLGDFVNYLISDRPVGFMQAVNGFDRFDEATIAREVIEGKWKLLTGLHALFYAPNLEAKRNYLSTLRAPNVTNLKLGKFDLGNLFGGVTHLFSEAQPSMVHAAVAAMLRSTNPDMSEEQRVRVYRLMIAVSEKEGIDVTEVMRKYTSPELVRIYDEVIEGGFRLKLLEKFDTRLDMLRELGFVPSHYDRITAAVIFNPNSGKTKQKEPLSGRARQLESTISKLAEVVKSKGDEGGTA